MAPGDDGMPFQERGYQGRSVPFCRNGSNRSQIDRPHVPGLADPVLIVEMGVPPPEVPGVPRIIRMVFGAGLPAYDLSIEGGVFAGFTQREVEPRMVEGGLSIRSRRPTGVTKRDLFHPFGLRSDGSALLRSGTSRPEASADGPEGVADVVRVSRQVGDADVVPAGPGSFIFEGGQVPGV